MKAIQGTRHLSFAGAYLRYGFHEDGFTSGLRAAADHIPDIDLPFDIQDPDRTPEHLWIATVFEFFEGSIWRRILGTYLSISLHLWRSIFNFWGVRINIADGIKKNE